MIEQLFQKIYEVIVSMFNWTNMIFDKYNGWSYILAAFTIVTIFRFVLFPLLGGRTITAGSDLARRIDNYLDEGKGGK